MKQNIFALRVWLLVLNALFVSYSSQAQVEDGSMRSSFSKKEAYKKSKPKLVFFNQSPGKKRMINNCDTMLEKLKNDKLIDDEMVFNTFIKQINNYFNGLSGLNTELTCQCRLSIGILEKVKTKNNISWNNKDMESFLEKGVQALSRGGYFETLHAFSHFIFRVLEENKEHYAFSGRKIEGHVCYALKNSGKKELCRHMFFPQKNSQASLFLDIGRLVYNEKWIELGPLLKSVKNETLKNGWDSYFQQQEGTFNFHAGNYIQACQALKTSISLVNEGDLVTDTLDKYLYLARCLRKRGEFSQALVVTDQGLSRLSQEVSGASFAGLALNLQKLLILKEAKMAVTQEVVKSFTSNLTEDSFSQTYKQSFEALLREDRRYGAPHYLYDYREVNLHLKTYRK